VVGWVLVEALVRAVVIDMVHILVEDGESMALVVDQQPVGALFADAANEPFGVAVCPGSLGRDLDDVDAFGGKTASKAAVNVASRSRIIFRIKICPN
jgi:hypothetical protein